jgi:hypothetical protein
MANKGNRSATHLDALGLFLAGLINTFMAAFVAGIVLGPGTRALQPDILARSEWITEHTLRWEGGWLFWFAVTLSFAWSYFALGRHLETALPWVSLAVGVALIAAAVDIVGVVINLTVLPELAIALAQEIASTATSAVPMLGVVYHAIESLAYALVNVVAFGLYSLAGLLLLPAVFATVGYPRWLAWLGAAEWGIAALATVLLVMAPALATGPLLISFSLYAPWVWGSAVWLLRGDRDQG